MLNTKSSSSVILQIVAMGFDPEMARRALYQSRASLERALEIIMQSGGILPPLPELPSTSSGASSSSPSSGKLSGRVVVRSCYNLQEVGEWGMLIFLLFLLCHLPFSSFSISFFPSFFPFRSTSIWFLPFSVRWQNNNGWHVIEQLTSFNKISSRQVKLLLIKQTTYVLIKQTTYG